MIRKSAADHGGREENIAKYLKSEEKPCFTQPGVYVFVAPCYVSTTARALCDLIKEATFPKDIRAYYVITGPATWDPKTIYKLYQRSYCFI